MTENELILFDRLEVIRKTIGRYGESNFYVSFSGGKESTVLHYLIDEALPNNTIPRVYINTGIEYNDILYYEPFNFKRTGCKGCPFALDLQNQLETMERLLPNERKQCEILWKPVYNEYRKIGYRLKKNEQGKLF